jgi:hypothetical protein
MSKYKRDDKEFKARIAARVKPFRKHEDKIITVTIDENGDVIFLATEANDVFLNHGEIITKRASHVEPVEFWARVFFHTLRWFGDKNRIAEWTRHWDVAWQVNTKPVGGHVLTWKDIYPDTGSDNVALWVDRQAAIDAEVKFLNVWFLERGIS